MKRFGHGNGSGKWPRSSEVLTVLLAVHITRPLITLVMPGRQ